MSDDPESGVKTKISKNELERRWAAVRHAMKEEGLDFLIMTNVTDILGGYVKWFTDMSANNNYPFTVIFPRDDEITIIRHGPRGVTKPDIHGIKKQIGVPDLPSLGFSSTFEAEMAVEELSKHGNCRIGLVGLSFIWAAFYNHLTGHLDTADFIDATDLVDSIKAIKSEEEIQHIRHLCALQDTTFEQTLTFIKPGRRDFEIYADIMHQCLLTGSSQANIMVGSGPLGEPKAPPGLRDRYREIREGDLVEVLIESNGPSGFFAEILGTFCLGEVPAELQEHFEIAQEAQKRTLKLLKPGADPMTIWDANNEFLKSVGYEEERRLLIHGMGYDMVEKPSVQIGETMKIQAGMNIAAHATATSGKWGGAVCENYLVKESGEAECLHRTTQKIYRL